VRVIAISVDSPEINREHCRKQGYTFTFLSDTHSEVIRRYDLLHEKGGPASEDISRPAEFLVDAGGKVRWANLAPSIAVRARPEEIVKVIDGLGLAAARSN